ncbi:PilT protein domain protein [Alkaliphilus metalliredigens QYMF]|uniref:PilT protein domain protein n=1 Tax=Alkaliphilus metalliredigens (strain QYMF) TaxID=293826 RepID=A6TWL1_ALKMQ|nr:PIN/TRAM domain-containing protein [Alkaliphilus metalliredigens]ABR50579.1 PilT protein domain protein [Alkaliphilus metalliredigens QYMF]
MINRILRGVVTALGALSGLGIFIYITNVMGITNTSDNFVGYASGIIISSLLGGFLLFMLAPWLINKGRNTANWIELELAKIPTANVILGSIGLIGGLIIAFLIGQLLNNIPIPLIGTILSTIVYIFMGYLGVTIAIKKMDELQNLNTLFKKVGVRDRGNKKESRVSPKVLDTSVIIDGRIADLCKTGFVEGPLVIPEFVLEELRHIADSSDALKRNRGRRGLDILNKIQKELDIEVQIHDKDFEDMSEVDTKLLKLAQLLDGKVVTNDYNLNKVAEFQGVPVLNINELANAVKPVVLPGEEMFVHVVKDGKESGQGLAYLDDGTMIVVESGKKYIGQNIDVLVTSVLQTAAGRMIFAKPKALADRTA